MSEARLGYILRQCLKEKRTSFRATERKLEIKHETCSTEGQTATETIQDWVVKNTSLISQVDIRKSQYTTPLVAILCPCQCTVPLP